LRIIVALGLVTLFWATLHIDKAYPESAPASIQLTADSGQDPYRLGARVDFRAKVTCTTVGSCGVLTLTVNLDPNLAYESYSMITADQRGPTTKASVKVLTSQRVVIFTIGTAAVGFGNGEYVTFPISARGISIPADKLLNITASAQAAGRTAAAALVIPTATGPGPNGAGKVSVGGCTWWDADRDGQRDSAESAAAALKVSLNSASGDHLDSAVTDATGCYAFADLDAGVRYQLSFTAPKGARFTTKPASGVGSMVAADGTVSFTAPLGGGDLVTHDATDLAGMDAGVISYNLVLTQTLLTTGEITAKDSVRYRLVVANGGESAALAGWRVSVVLPKQLKLVSLVGAGFSCSGSTCTAKAPLKGGSSAAAITLTARLSAAASGAVSAVSYVRPATADVAESVPLSTVPTASTKTEATVTDNDARVVVQVTATSGHLADTGAGGVLEELSLGVLLGAVGGGLLLTRRSRAAN
jgi:hypothetical protein